MKKEIIVIGALISASTPLLSATFVTNTFKDGKDTNPGDGVCSDNTGKCTLRAAIQEANAITGIDTVLLNSGTYTITSIGVDDIGEVGDLDILESVTISGKGMDSTVIDGQYQSRIFDIPLLTDKQTRSNISGPRVVHLDNLALTRGTSEGNKGAALRSNYAYVTVTKSAIKSNDDKVSAIYAINSELTVNESVFSNNWQGINIITQSPVSTKLEVSNSEFVDNGTAGARLTDAPAGGAISSKALTTKIFRSTFSGNIGNAGGAIDLTGDAIIEESTLTGNTAAYSIVDGGGGAIRNKGILTLKDSRLTKNTSYNRGGAVANWGTARIINSTISNNSCTSRYSDSGGGITNGGALWLIDTLVNANAADSGAGIYNEFGTLNVANSAILDNTATGAGGGITSNRGKVFLKNSEIGRNKADDGAGIYAKYIEDVVISNSTIHNNTAKDIGGGVWLDGSSSDDYVGSYSTIAHNNAASDEPAGIYVKDSRILLSSTILENESGVSECEGTLLSLGGNIASDQSCNLKSMSDSPSTKAALGELAKGPGKTSSFVPKASIVGATATCDAVGHLDQFYNYRAGASCTSGAVEPNASKADRGIFSHRRNLCFAASDASRAFTVDRIDGSEGNAQLKLISTVTAISTLDWTNSELGSKETNALSPLFRYQKVLYRDPSLKDYYLNLWPSDGDLITVNGGDRILIRTYNDQKSNGFGEFSQTVFNAYENDGYASITITRNTTIGTATFLYRVLPGSAKFGEDISDNLDSKVSLPSFEGAWGQKTFNPGVKTINIKIPLVVDGENGEPKETFYVQLFNRDENFALACNIDAEVNVYEGDNPNGNVVTNDDTVDNVVTNDDTVPANNSSSVLSSGSTKSDSGSGGGGGGAMGLLILIALRIARRSS